MIITTDHGPVRELRLDRPPANALTPELIVELREALTRAPEEGVKAMVLSGRPGRFSGGLDVPYLLPLDREGMEHLWRELYRLLQTLAASPVPIAAAITGHSPAGGAVLAMFCDYRVMAEGDFLIGLNEVHVGIVQQKLRSEPALPSSKFTSRISRRLRTPTTTCPTPTSLH